MTNIKKDKEEVKEGKLKKHFKKYGGVYINVAGAGLIVVGMKIGMDSKLKQVSHKSYMKGIKDMNQMTWEMLANNVKDGILKMDLISDTVDIDLKRNMETLRSFVEAE